MIQTTVTVKNLTPHVMTTTPTKRNHQTHLTIAATVIRTIKKMNTLIRKPMKVTSQLLKKLMTENLDTFKSEYINSIGVLIYMIA